MEAERQPAMIPCVRATGTTHWVFPHEIEDADRLARQLNLEYDRQCRGVEEVPSEGGSSRKPHSGLAGYFSERKIPRAKGGGYAVILRAKEAGIDARRTFVVMHLPSNEFVEAANIREARQLMKDAANEQLNRWWS